MSQISDIHDLMKNRVEGLAMGFRQFCFEQWKHLLLVRTLIQGG